MSKITPEQRQRYRNASEMNKSFAASEWLIQEKVDQLGYTLYKLLQEARTLYVEEEYFYAYIDEKLLEMVHRAVRANVERYQGKKRG